jgi:hypothetical protein
MKGEAMTAAEENKAILESLADAESILYYAKDDNPYKEQIDAMQELLHDLMKSWHELTGVTL